MDHFEYKDNILHAEGVSIPDIVDTVGTPFYCYSTATFVRHYHVFTDAFEPHNVLTCFAVKANSNLAILATLAKEGAGADCVSEGEIRRSIKAGIPAEKIVFSGVGKTIDEMDYALDIGIHQFNVESGAELHTLNEVAGAMGKKAPIAIRVNPDVEAGAHDKISTGRKEDKFGIAYHHATEIYKVANALPHINVVGISTHIGSQLTDLAPFKQAFSKIIDLVKKLQEEHINIKRIDLGGGLGIPYDEESPPPPTAYAEMILELTADLRCELIFEPGRLIAGNAGILVSKVIYPKMTDHKHFLIIDAAMNDLLRPSLYGAYHEIIPVIKPIEGSVLEKIDVVGPVCETGDTFAKNRMLPPLDSQDLLAFRSCGAYGAVMANSYNSRLLIPEILVHKNQFTVIRSRPTYDTLLASDTIPDWI